MTKERNPALFAVPLLYLTLLAQGAPALEPIPPKITPPTVEMGMFYGGADVHVAGRVAEGSNIIVVVRGPSAAEIFNKVGRVGPIWVSTGKVTISDVPSLLLIFSSEPVNTCLNAPAIGHYQLDLASLQEHMQIETEAPDRSRIAADFLAFKALRGTYGISSRSVRLGAPEQGEIPYSLDFKMPRAANPGKYQVTVLECRNGDVASQWEVDLGLVEVGFPALVARLARGRAALYGIMSIIIAMVAGFGIDFLVSRIFERKAAAH